MKLKLMTPEGRAAALKVPSQADFRRYNAGGYPDRQPTTSAFSAPFARGAPGGPPPGGPPGPGRAPGPRPGPTWPGAVNPGSVTPQAGRPSFRAPAAPPTPVSSGVPGLPQRPPAPPHGGGTWRPSGQDARTRAAAYAGRTSYTGQGLWQSERAPSANPHRPVLDAVDPGDGVVTVPGVTGRRPPVLDEIQQVNAARARAPVAPVSQQDMLGTYAKQVLAPTAPEGQAPAGWGTSSSGLTADGKSTGEEPAQTWTDEEVRDAGAPVDVVERYKNTLFNNPPPPEWRGTEEEWREHLYAIFGNMSAEDLLAAWARAIGDDDVNGGQGYSADDLARALANGYLLVDVPGTTGWRWQRITDRIAWDESDREFDGAVDTVGYLDPSEQGTYDRVTGRLQGQRSPNDPAPEDEFDLDALFEEGRAELDAIDARASAARDAAIEAAQRERALQLSRALRVANMVGASNNMPPEAVFGSMAEMGRATGLSGATEDARTRLEGEMQSAQREWDFWRQRVEIANANQNRQAAEASARYATMAQERLMRLQDSLNTPTAGEAALGLFGGLLGSAGSGLAFKLGGKLV